MCGRKFSDEHLTWTEYRNILSIVSPPPTNFAPNYNIAPTQQVPVCRRTGHLRSLDLLHWGLVPHWAKDRKSAAKMINARAETLEEKPSFRGLLNRNRCIVIVSGFYEWHRKGKSSQPYKVEHDDHRPMLLAGLWTRNTALEIESYCIITTEATESFGAIHHRLPAILDRESIDVWLNDDWSAAKKLTETWSGDLKATPISSAVNKVANNGPSLLDPLPRNLFGGIDDCT